MAGVTKKSYLKLVLSSFFVMLIMFSIWYAIDKGACDEDPEHHPDDGDGCNRHKLSVVKFLAVNSLEVLEVGIIFFISNAFILWFSNLPTPIPQDKCYRFFNPIKNQLSKHPALYSILYATLISLVLMLALFFIYHRENPKKIKNFDDFVIHKAYAWAPTLCANIATLARTKFMKLFTSTVTPESIPLIPNKPKPPAPVATQQFFVAPTTPIATDFELYKTSIQQFNSRITLLLAKATISTEEARALHKQYLTIEKKAQQAKSSFGKLKRHAEDNFSLALNVFTNDFSDDDLEGAREAKAPEIEKERKAQLQSTHFRGVFDLSELRAEHIGLPSEYSDFKHELIPFMPSNLESTLLHIQTRLRSIDDLYVAIEFLKRRFRRQISLYNDVLSKTEHPDHEDLITYTRSILGELRTPPSADDDDSLNFDIDDERHTLIQKRHQGYATIPISPSPKN